MATRDMGTYLIQSATDNSYKQLLLLTWYVDGNANNTKLLHTPVIVL